MRDIAAGVDGDMPGRRDGVADVATLVVVIRRMLVAGVIVIGVIVAGVVMPGVMVMRPRCGVMRRFVQRLHRPLQGQEDDQREPAPGGKTSHDR